MFEIIDEKSAGYTFSVHRDLKTLVVELTTLTPDPTNARKHSGKNIDAIAQSLKKYGQRTPVVFQRSADGRAIVRKGNGTVDAARQLKWTHVAALEIHEDDTQAAAYAIADNRTAELASWDYAQLIATLESFETLNATGFDDDAFRDLLAKFKEDTRQEGKPANMDQAAAHQLVWKVEPGDVWVADGHIVVCGDAADPASFAHAGEPFYAVITDPPYGVAYEGKSRNRIAIESDAMTEIELSSMLERAFDNVLDRTEPGSGWYVFGPQGPLSLAFGAALHARGVWRQTLIWVKQRIVVGRSDYHYRHEPVFYGWAPGAAHRFYGDRKQSSILEFDRPAASKIHPTMKPVDLIAHLLGLSSAPGDLVADPFAGSGTLFEAAWRLGRRSYSVELSPTYVACILERMRANGLNPQKRH